LDHSARLRALLAMRNLSRVQPLASLPVALFAVVALGSITQAACSVPMQIDRGISEDRLSRGYGDSYGYGEDYATVLEAP